MIENLWKFLAWKMPDRLVYWCAIRLMSAASTGKYSSYAPSEISVIDALDAWESEQ